MKVYELFEPLNEYRQKVAGADLSKHTKAVWDAKNLDAKKTAMYALIDNYRFKGNEDKHRALVDKETSALKLDMMANNFMQSGEGNKVIK